MRGATWVSLLRRIPQALHEKLVVVTTTNTEIIVQGLVRLDREYVVLRGRMSGTQETGRIIFVPYDQINFVGVARTLSEAEVQGLLGKPGEGQAPDAASEAVEALEPVGDDAGEVVDFVSPVGPTPPSAGEAPPGESQPAAPAAAEAPRPDMPSKTALLARLRSRLAGDRSRSARPGPGQTSAGHL